MFYEIFTENFTPYGNSQGIEWRVAQDENCRPSMDAFAVTTPAMQSLQQLIVNCWKGDPTERPTALQVVVALEGVYDYHMYA